MAVKMPAAAGIFHGGKMPSTLDRSMNLVGKIAPAEPFDRHLFLAPFFGWWKVRVPTFQSRETFLSNFFVFKGSFEKTYR